MDFLANVTRTERSTVLKFGHGMFGHGRIRGIGTRMIGEEMRIMVRMKLVMRAVQLIIIVNRQR